MGKKYADVMRLISGRTTMQIQGQLLRLVLKSSLEASTEEIVTKLPPITE